MLRDVERPETSPLMAPAHPPPSLTRRGPAEGKLFPTSEICQLHWRHLREISPHIWGRFLSPPRPHQKQRWLKNISEKCPEMNNCRLGRCFIISQLKFFNSSELCTQKALS